MTIQAHHTIQPAAPAKRKGCFFYGCLISIIVLIVVVIGIWIGARYVISSMVEQYTQAAPMELPALDSSTESYLKVKGKVEEFQSFIRQGKAATLELTGPEINTYLSSHPGLEGLTDNFRISIDGSDLRGAVSAPLESIGYPDRYLNGTLSLQVEMKDGDLKAWLRGLEVGGKAIPDSAVQQIGQGNLLDQAEPEKKQKLLEALAGVKLIEVQNGILRMAGGGEHQS